MREVRYLSPSSLGVFDKNERAFYMRYLADQRPPRDPQTQPMSIGSAFDARVKAFLQEKLFGKGSDPKYELRTLFESQVERQWWDWAWPNSEYVFEQYRQTGALSDMLVEIAKAQSEPRFEFEVEGAIHHFRESDPDNIYSVTFLGKPDLHYINAAGITVILDFKVNGYCSDRAQDPMAGYVKLRSGGRTNHGQHKQCQPSMWNGVIINIAGNLERYNKDWARQLSIYAWLTGQPVGSDFLVAIDQLACSPNPGGLPTIRVAEHRTRVSKGFQQETFNRAAQIWEIIHSDHLFRNMSPEASREHAAMLDRQSMELAGSGADHDRWFSGATRSDR